MTEPSGYTASVPVRVKVYYHNRLVGGLVDMKLPAGKVIKIKYIKGKVNLGGEIYSTPVGIRESPQIKPPIENGNLGALYGVWVSVEADGSYSYQYDSAFLIGSQKVATVPANKYLFMFVNDDYYNDNSGFYEIEISPGEEAAKEELSERDKEFYSQGKIDMESAPWQTSGSNISSDGKIGDFDLKTALKTGFQVKKGDVLTITATGAIKVGDRAGTSSPRGISGYQDYNFFMNFTHASLLIGIAGPKFSSYVEDVGYRSSIWKECGESCKFVAEQDGEIWLLVNDKGYSNNSGSYKVTVNRQIGGSPTRIPTPSNKTSSTAPVNKQTNQPSNTTGGSIQNSDFLTDSPSKTPKPKPKSIPKKRKKISR